MAVMWYLFRVPSALSWMNKVLYMPFLFMVNESFLALMDENSIVVFEMSSYFSAAASLLASFAKEAGSGSNWITTSCPGANTEVVLTFLS